MTTSSRKLTDIRITVLGGGAVGKTAFTIQLVSHHFVEFYDPTIESSYRQQFVVDDQIAMLDILDTAGQEEYTALQAQWIRSGEGFVLLYSITDQSTFDEIERFRTKILNVKDVSSENAPPIVLVGNKVDLTENREVATNEGADFAKRIGCDFFEASAKTRLNVQESFFQLVRRIRERQSTGGKSDETGGVKKPSKKARCTLF
eukprot:TRINITY_DN2784_c0_g1_i1.p1 TRINITY_DN2784_c0_g1~~TRINITY_DN2784_c0_g1_i1.p1  ORF type:complete len:203 (+),score=32.28 TRINITY_DN2784_c0_g1_i1:104-712(+)